MSDRGQEQSPAVSPDRRDRRARRRAGACEEVPERDVHEVGAPARRPHPVGTACVRLLERAELGLECVDGIGRVAHASARGRRGPSHPSGSG